MNLSIAVEDLPETPFFFDHPEARLFGILYEPAESGPRADGRGILFCPPFAEEAAISQRVCVNFARLLAQRGYHVLRFDYRGSGDSEGTFDQTSLSTYVADIRWAVRVFRERTGVRVGLFGLRLGATLAAIASANLSEIDSLLLWEPVVGLEEHAKNFIRAQVVARSVLVDRTAPTRKELIAQLSSGQTVDILGYPLSSVCFGEFLRWDVFSSIGGKHGPVLIAGINRRRRVRRDLEALADAYRGRAHPVELLYVEGQRFWTDPDAPWREIRCWYGHEDLFAQSVDWLDRLGPRRHCDDRADF